jgi:transposase InsO family protein
LKYEIHSRTENTSEGALPSTTPSPRAARNPGCFTAQIGRPARWSTYVERLTEIGALASMSAKGNPYDKAKAEGFFKTLKREEVYLNQYETFADAVGQISRFIGRMLLDVVGLGGRLAVWAAREA